MDAQSTSAAAHLQELERLYRAARSPSERDILLKALRIVSPQQSEQLEELILRAQVREMPIENLLQLISDQKKISTQEADFLLRDLAFEKLLDRAQLKISAGAPTDAPAPVQAAPAPSKTVVSTPVNATPLPRTRTGLVGKLVPDVRIQEDPDHAPTPPPAPPASEASPLEFEEDAAAPSNHGITMMPRGIGR